jgi:hypothetical protein
MPKTIIDYSKTIIYKLVNYDCPDLVYVGSTTNFTKRKQQHKSHCVNISSPKYSRKLYVSIRASGGWETWNMIKICDYPCNNKREAETEEDRYMIELKANLNMQRASRTKKQYREENKEKINDKKKQYYEDNKDKVKEHCKEYRENNKEKIKQFYEDNKDKKKQYYEDNKELIKENRKEYRENNKEKIKQYRMDNNVKIKQYYEANKDKNKIKCTCECGAIIQHCIKAQHIKTIKHQKYLNTIE